MTAFAQGTGGAAGGAAGSAAGAAGGSAGEGYKQSAGAAGANTANIPGWNTMSAQEQGEMQQRMQSLRNYNECQSYMTQHSSRMMSQARAPQAAAAGNDPCAHLPRS